MQIATSITISGQPVCLAVPSRSRAWQKANSIFCPLGPAPTRGWFLLTKKSVDVLAGSSSQAHSIVWTQTSQPTNAAQVTLTFEGMYLVHAERLLLGSEDDPSALYLCDFADGRFLAARRGVDSGSSITNFRSYANTSDYLTGTSGGTWDSLLEELWDACGTLGTYPGLPNGLPIDGVPQNVYLVGLSAYRALCAVLNQLDCAIDHDPLSNTYTIVQLGGPQTIPENDDTLQYNGQPANLTGHTAAANLRIYFHYHRKSYGQERDTELANNWAYDGAGDVKEIATGISGSSGMKPLWDDLPWILDENNTVSNNTALNTRRDNRKSRYVSRNTVAPQHRIHAGLHDNIVTGGKVRAVLWRNYGDGAINQTGGTVTEFVAGVDLIFEARPVGQNGATISWFDSGMTSPEYETFAPPDLARHSYPTYPRLPNMVQVHHTSGSPSPGDPVSPSADGFHPGRIRRWVANAMVTLGDCWIRFVDHHDSLDGAVGAVQDEFYYGRCSGVTTSGGSLLPVYLVKKGETGTGVVAVEFTLTSGFTSLAATATVTQSLDPDTADGASITVHDVQSRWADAISGAKGTAIRNADFTDSPETQPYWHIVSCQRAINKAKATLTATMCGVNPTVDTWTPLPNGEHVVDPGAGTLLNAIASGGAGHYGVNGDIVWFNRINNAPTFQWRVDDVNKHPTTVMTNWRVDGSNIKATTVSAALEYCTAPNEDVLFALTSIDYVSNVANATGVITQTKRAAKVLGDAVGADTTVITLTQKTFVTSVAADSDSLNKITFTAYVYSPSGDTTTDIIGLTTACP